MKTISRLVLLLCLMSPAFLKAGPACCSGVHLEALPLDAVQLLEGAFLDASRLNEAYVMAHDPDRLLAPFLIDAGLEPKAERYGNWENSGLDGHTAGHYLTALALIYASTGSEEASGRLEYMLNELERCQQANGNGYLGGIPGGLAMWQDIADGKIEADLFSLNGKWVPWYNIHKLFAGLRDAYLHTGSEQALRIWIALTDWVVELCSNLDDDQIQTMLIAEHGGMNEVFADLFAITDNLHYLELAERFSHRLVLDPLLEREDRLTGLHANTQIPKVIGFLRTASLSGLRNWEEAADFFWRTVVEHRSVAIGGNSTYEHFHPRDDFSSMIESRQGPETCNTYNMMRLAFQLYLKSGSVEYIDYYERALYNHILGSQHPEHGGLVYFTSMRPRHYRVYSLAEETFWCCVGSGIENHAKYGELIYSTGPETLYVNLFIPSAIDWESKGVRLIQRTAFPENETVSLEIDLEAQVEFTLSIRHPGWVAPDALVVSVNGEELADRSSNPGSYFEITRTWSAGDVVEWTLPMETYVEGFSDGSPYYAFLHGPIVLAADAGRDELIGLVADGSRMGHVAHGPLRPIETAPVILLDSGDASILDKIQPVSGSSLSFELKASVLPNTPTSMILKPFYQLHDARYIVYWPVHTPETTAALMESIAAREREQMEMERLTIDRVQPGQQQPEAEHRFKGEGTESGINRDRHWRHATGWFSYELQDAQREAEAIMVTYVSTDSGRVFDILINGELLQTVRLDSGGVQGFFNEHYVLPEEIIDAAEGVFEVRFQAHPESVAGGIYDLRLIRSDKNGVKGGI